MRDKRIPGAALAVIQRGKMIKVQGYGLASIELEVPVSPNGVFDIASITKPITATALTHARRRGARALGGSHQAHFYQTSLRRGATSLSDTC